MSGTAAFPFVPMAPPQQMPTPGQPSRLAAAIAAERPNFNSGSANTGAQFAGPLLQMLKDMQKNKSDDPAYRREGFGGQGSDLLNGQQWGNVMSGRQWDGMPGQSGLAQLLGTDLNSYTKAAQTNVAGMGGGGWNGGGVI